MNSTTLDPSFTFTRSSTAWGYDSTGTLASFAVDAPRVDYDPSTARTNIIPNNMASGGGAGVRPTGWVAIGTSNGLSTSYVGVGVEDGIEYIDIRLSGTTLAATTLRHIVPTGTTTNAPLVSGSTQYNLSAYIRLVGGSFNGITATALRYDWYDQTGGSAGTSSTGSALTITSAALSTQRYRHQATTPSGAYFGRPSVQVTYADASVVDMTLRFGLAQMETGGSSTAVIRTTVAAVSACDIKGLLVEDSRTNSIRNNSTTGATSGSPNLITNGDFAVSPINATTGVFQQGWTWTINGGTGTVTHTGSAVSILGDGTNEGAIDTFFTTSIGVNYLLTYTTTATASRVRIGITQGGGTIYNATPALGLTKIAFTATATTTWVRFARSAASTSTIDDVSVYESAVLNGDFALDPVNVAQNTLQNGWQWSVAGTATVAYVSTAVDLTGDATNFANLDATFTTVSGTTYIVTVDVATNAVTATAGTTQGGGTLFNGTVSTGTSKRFGFVATSTTTWLRFKTSTAAVSTVDNVSVISAGTGPTNVSLPAALSTQAVSWRIVALGTENGIPYADMEISGTGDGNAFRWNFEPSNVIAASVGQTWTHSVYVKLVSGTMTGISTFGVEIREYASGAGLTQDATNYTPTTGIFAASRKTHTRTTTDATITHVQPTIRIATTAATAIQCVIRVGGNQLELGASATSLIPTTSATITRAVDQCIQNPIGAWYRPNSPWTVKMKAVMPYLPPATGTISRHWTIDDGTVSNRIQLRVTPGATVAGVYSSSGGVTGQPNGGATITAGVAFKVAASNDGTIVRACTDGGSIGTSALPAYPIGITTARLHGVSTAAINGWIQEIYYWPRGMSDGELKAVTT